MSFEEGKKNASQLLKDHKDIDGIFINTDLVAIGAMTELIKQGVKIPDDISVVGFSNWFMASIISPSLTTINQPGLEMGKNSFKLLYKEIKERKKKKTINYKELVLETELVIRDSTKS
jgi:LacI family transcriptional regulator